MDVSPLADRAWKSTASVEGGQTLSYCVSNLNHNNNMLKLLFSHHSPNYIGVAYLGISIPVHRWVIPYTPIQTNTIIHMIKVLRTIILINFLQVIHLIPVIPQLCLYDYPPVTLQVRIPYVIPVTEQTHILLITTITSQACSRLFSITPSSMIM